MPATWLLYYKCKLGSLVNKAYNSQLEGAGTGTLKYNGVKEDTIQYNTI